MSTFTVGQEVRAVATRGLWRFTEGSVYTVVGVIPRACTPTFTYPEYVIVLDDYGDRCWCHTYRFQAI